jgi:hypothetical protein
LPIKWKTNLNRKNRHSTVQKRKYKSKQVPMDKKYKSKLVPMAKNESKWSAHPSLKSRLGYPYWLSRRRSGTTTFTTPQVLAPDLQVAN